MCVKTVACSPSPWKSPRFFLNKKLEASIMREMELIDTISKLNHPHVVGARALAQYKRVLEYLSRYGIR